MKVSRYRIILTVFVALMIAAPSFVLAEDQTNEVIVFNDADLESLVRYTLKKPAGSIFQSDVSRISDITAPKAEIKNIHNIDALKYFTNLRSLNLSQNNNIIDISPLKNLIKLERLNLEAYKFQPGLITDISPLGGLVNLKILKLTNNNITDISALSNLVNLQELDLSQNNITDINSLQYLSKLKKLSLFINYVSDISPLRNLLLLETLGADFNNIKDVSPLRNLSSLKVLCLRSNSITNIDSMRSLINLEQLYLEENFITSISALSKLTKLKRLSIWGNIKITDYSPINNLVNLETENSTIRFIESLKKFSRQANEVIKAVIRPGMTDLEKETAIHDYILTHYQYDDAKIRKLIKEDDKDSLSGLGVCGTFSGIFRALLDKVGIESRHVHGYVKGNIVGHSWNLVKIEGKFYHVDVTYNGPEFVPYGKSARFAYSYFNVDDKIMEGYGRKFKKFYPVCNSGELLPEGVQDSSNKKVRSKFKVVSNNTLPLPAWVMSNPQIFKFGAK